MRFFPQSVFGRNPVNRLYLGENAVMVRTPGYRLHRPSGRAIVTLNGKDHYLGVHGSTESKAAVQTLTSIHHLWFSTTRKYKSHHELDKLEELEELSDFQILTRSPTC